MQVTCEFLTIIFADYTLISQRSI